jgi:hypothetical protein
LTGTCTGDMRGWPQRAMGGRRGVVAVAGARLACAFEDPALTTWEAEEPTSWLREQAVNSATPVAISVGVFWTCSGSGEAAA